MAIISQFIPVTFIDIRKLDIELNGLLFQSGDITSLPFEDNSIDFVYSHSVFEHVQNYPESIAEIARILKPEGYCLHYFPGRYRPVESHVFVPLASIIQSRFWLRLWTSLGVRNEFSYDLSAKETTEMFYNYLKTETNYLTRKQLVKHFKTRFNDVRFCEGLSVKHSARRGKYLYAVSKHIPVLHALYSALRTRVVFTGKPVKI
jgi:ubiquinone/menaquinone biosynthesis C-methylase UbiE